MPESKPIDQVDRPTTRRGFMMPLLASGLVLLVADIFFYRIGWRALADLSFNIGMLAVLLWCVLRLNGGMRRLLTVPVDARFLPATRVIYALMCLYTAVQHLWAVGYGMEPSNFDLLGWPESKPMAYVLNAGYFAALIALLFGKGVRAAWIAIFLLGGLLMPFSLELFVKTPLNFFALFVPPALWRGDRSAETPWSGWPLLMAGACITFITTGAGLFKLLDPVWQHGTGFYYSLNIPFFCPKHLWPLLDSWPLMLFGNWACIVFEVLALPLFLIPRTRVIGLACVLGLGIFLSWPMWGIGLVGGPVVLAFVPAWAGLCPGLVRWWEKRTWAKRYPARVIAPGIVTRPLPYYAVGIAWWTFMGFAGDVIGKYDLMKTSPPVYGTFQVPGASRINLPSHVEHRIRSTAQLLDAIRPHRLYEVAWLLELFDYHHLFERSIYRIRIEDRQGQWHTIDYFDEDGALLPSVALGGYVHMLKPVVAVRSLRQRDRTGDFARYSVCLLNHVISYAIHQLPEGTQAKQAIMDVKPLHMPLRFEGNSKPWVLGNSYAPFYRYDPATGTGEVIGEVAPYPFEQLDVPAFRDRVIVPAPDAPVSYPTPTAR